MDRMPPVIFVTAYDRHALKAFEVNALDYLLKPFDTERFAKALKRAKAQIEHRQISDLSRRLQTLIDDLKTDRKYAERLVIKSAGRIFFLSVDEIDWIEAADNYVRLHAAREAHLLRETMNSLEKRLDPEQFIRVHRSRIVNTLPAALLSFKGGTFAGGGGGGMPRIFSRTNLPRRTRDVRFA